MTVPDTLRRGNGGNVLIGVFLGALLGLITGVLPVAAFLVVPALLAAFAAILIPRPLRFDRLATFGGILIGGGAFYTYGVVNTVLACLGTSDFCGRADVLPLIVVAASLLAAGTLVAVSAGRRARR